MHVDFLEDRMYNKYYGFLQREVDELLDRFDLTHTRHDVHRWYDGYKIFPGNISIYNPWSLVNYVTTRKLEIYWSKTELLDPMYKLLASKVMKEKMLQLLRYETVTVWYGRFMYMGDLDELKKVIFSNLTHETLNSDLYLQYLTDNGYFTADIIKSKEVEIRIPNQEIYICSFIILCALQNHCRCTVKIFNQKTKHLSIRL